MTSNGCSGDSRQHHCPVCALRHQKPNTKDPIADRPLCGKCTRSLDAARVHDRPVTVIESTEARNGHRDCSLT